MAQRRVRSVGRSGSTISCTVARGNGEIVSKASSATRRLGRTRGGQENLMDYRYEDIAKMIDHSLLNPSLTTSELEEGCRVALDYDAASVCIMPYALRWC